MSITDRVKAVSCHEIHLDTSCSLQIHDSGVNVSLILAHVGLSMQGNKFLFYAGGVEGVDVGVVFTDGINIANMMDCVIFNISALKVVLDFTKLMQK